uniref:Sine oculis-binding protein homolog n=1 Tax=Eptatretus burgeri TaxID=7764 RepID=A0A8C4NEL1_EPTBU
MREGDRDGRLCEKRSRKPARPLKRKLRVGQEQPKASNKSETELCQDDEGRVGTSLSGTGHNEVVKEEKMESSQGDGEMMLGNDCQRNEPPCEPPEPSRFLGKNRENLGDCGRDLEDVDVERGLSPPSVAHAIVPLMASSSTPTDTEEVASSVVCAWCHQPCIGRYSLPMAGEMRSFCSDKCFSAGRRAHFKRSKVCDWCKQLRPTLDHLGFGDGDGRLRFCSAQCLQRYKMDIFYTETRANLPSSGAKISLDLPHCERRPPTTSPSSQDTRSPIPPQGPENNVYPIQLSPLPVESKRSVMHSPSASTQPKRAKESKASFSAPMLPVAAQPRKQPSGSPSMPSCPDQTPVSSTSPARTTCQQSTETRIHTPATINGPIPPTIPNLHRAPPPLADQPGRAPGFMTSFSQLVPPPTLILPYPILVPLPIPIPIPIPVPFPAPGASTVRIKEEQQDTVRNGKENENTRKEGSSETTNHCLGNFNRDNDEICKVLLTQSTDSSLQTPTVDSNKVPNQDNIEAKLKCPSISRLLSSSRPSSKQMSLLQVRPTSLTSPSISQGPSVPCVHELPCADCTRARLAQAPK